MKSGWEACRAAHLRGPCQYKALAGWLSALDGVLAASSPEQSHFLKRCHFLQQCWWVLPAGLKAVHSKAGGIRVIIV